MEKCDLWTKFQEAFGSILGFILGSIVYIVIMGIVIFSVIGAVMLGVRILQPL
jgi:hypothetical protein